ncbi:hypothetical protein MSAN_02265000 [Mycena sanguinolenta]|uniref:C2H2-type domain-containing protein n=1 Tax=Mycena sanguinolenta TaxID=230812 RepID=A0A8H7CH20_9AGAR|nr:hypothetical protein MSAN_02265000 [Mycena sanguinolenta]
MTTSTATIVLPSIHEMFPEHLMPPAHGAHSRHYPQHPAHYPHAQHPHHRDYYPAPPPRRGFSFDVLKSDPRGASLQHVSTTQPAPPQRPSSFSASSSAQRRPALPAVRTAPARSTSSARARSPYEHPSASSSYTSTSAYGSARSPAHSSSSQSSDGDADMEEDYPLDSADADGADADADGAEDADADGGAKKHVCPTCSKRFNRPSSLRIHVNTHTGATPFRCPTPLLRPCIQRQLQHAKALPEPRRCASFLILIIIITHLLIITSHFELTTARVPGLAHLPRTVTLPRLRHLVELGVVPGLVPRDADNAPLALGPAVATQRHGWDGVL